MTTLHAFDIPELREYIAYYMDLESLRACAAVCKAWHENIQPLVWRTYRLHPRKLFTRGEEAWVTIMNKNAHWIRCLQRDALHDYTSVAKVVYDTLRKHCRNLVQFKGAVRNMLEWNHLKELVQVNPKLRSLELEFYGYRIHDFGPYMMFIQPIGGGSGGCSQLKSLRLNCSIPTEALKRMLLACPALEEVFIAEINETAMSTMRIASLDNLNNSSGNQGREWSELQIRQTPTTSPPPLSSKLRSLHITEHCRDPALVDLLERLPSLTCLEMPCYEILVIQQLCQIIKKGCLRQLKTISLRELSKTSTSRFVLPVLNAIPRHQLQNVTLYSVGITEIKLLVDHHHHSLESVVFYDAPPEALITILTGCPHLKKLHMSSTSPVDVHQLLGQPWICTSSLEELSAMLCLPPATETEEPATIEKEFMIQLGHCTQLRELMIRQHHRGETMELTWSLAHGLNHLESLSRLEMISFGGWMSFDVPELQFMKEHWPRLKYLPLVIPNSDDTLTWLRENWPTAFHMLSRNANRRIFLKAVISEYIQFSV